MRQRSRILIVVAAVVLLFAATRWLVAPQPPASACHLTMLPLGRSNTIAGASVMILGLTNDGRRAVQVLPVFGIELEPLSAQTGLSGAVPGGIKTLHPGDLWTFTVPLPFNVKGAWRIFFRYWEERTLIREFSHFCLKFTGLARREDPSFIAYTDWMRGGSSKRAVARDTREAEIPSVELPRDGVPKER